MNQYVLGRTLSATYQIASDQFRLRYRTLHGASYLEFPKQFSFLKSLTKHPLITVATCDNVKVAMLPLLPYEPLFLENNVIDNIGFRRLPDLRFESISLNIAASIGPPSSSAPHGSFGIKFGFSSTDNATIPLTWAFPRSMRCQLNNVPLIPILEVLPWNPDDVGSLVGAVVKVEQLRKDYTEKSVTLEQLLKLQMNDDSVYSALLDFSAYSLMYEMFDGNVFAQVRAHIGNKVCTLVTGHPSAFSGPFEALPDNFTHRLVARLKSKIRLVMPACRASEELVTAYENSPTIDAALPLAATFKTCLDATTTPMMQCLASVDAPRDRPTCNGVTCEKIASTAITDEILLEEYDQRFFSALIMTKRHRL